MDIFELLKEIEKRPSLFLFSPSIFSLYAFLEGYFCACYTQGLNIEYENVFSEFQDWLAIKYSKLRDAGIVRSMDIILAASCFDEHQALKEFFIFFDQFLQEKSLVGCAPRTINGCR